jgi:large subunit ribosomal protein L21
MTDFAIVKTGGKQYRVRVGDTVAVERLPGEVGDSVELDHVLLTSVQGEVTVGSPEVDRARVGAEITEQDRGQKVTVFHFKNKTRQRTKRGHRQDYTQLLIKGISSTRRRRSGSQEG